MIDISREIRASRRPFATFEKILGNVRPNHSKIANPNHTPDRLKRRPFAILEFVADEGEDAYCTHRYYAPNGRQIWRADHGSQVHGVAIDSEGNVYTAGSAGDSQTPPNRCKRLTKWSNRGGRIWSIAAENVSGLDVACDSEGNAWLAIGTALEKYSPNGILLASYQTINWPDWEPATHQYAFVPNIARVAISPTDRIVFGASSWRVLYPQDIFHPFGILAGNTMDIDGGNQAVFAPFAYGFPPEYVGGTPFDFTLTYNGYDFDADGNFYSSNQLSQVSPEDPNGLNIIDHELYVVSTATVFPWTPFLNTNNVTLTNIACGFAVQNIFLDDFPYYKVAGEIAVHRPTGRIMMAFGVNGAGRILDIADMTPNLTGTDRLDTQPTLVEESGAGVNCVLRVNDNHRYVYGVSEADVTHRVRDYPSDFAWEGDHKGAVRDAVIQNSGHVLVGGDRVFDPQ